MSTRNPYNKSASRYRKPTGLYYAIVSRVEGTEVYVKVPRLSVDFEHGPIPYVGALPQVGAEVFVGFLEGSMDDVVAIFPGGSGAGGGPIERTYLVAAIDCRPALRNVADYVCDGTEDWEQIGTAIQGAATLGGGRVALTEGVFEDHGNTNPLTWTTGSSDIVIEGAGRYATVLDISNTNPGGTGMIVPPGGGRITFRNMTIIGDDANGSSAAEYVYYHGTGYTAFDNVYIESYTPLPGC